LVFVGHAGGIAGFDSLFVLAAFGILLCCIVDVVGILQIGYGRMVLLVLLYFGVVEYIIVVQHLI